MAETGIGGFRFGMLAIRNGRLVERLRSGGRIWPETEERIRKFMVSEKERRALRASERARQSHSKINGTVPLEAAR